MSWLSDRFSDVSKFYGQANHDIWSFGGHFENDVSKFFKNEVADKSDLRGSQIESVVGGLPIAGDIVRGIEGATQLEDLYNRTGKTAEYPAFQGGPASSLGHSISDISKKIEEGSHDLYKFYTGTDDAFRTKMNNMYG